MRVTSIGLALVVSLFAPGCAKKSDKEKPQSAPTGPIATGDAAVAKAKASSAAPEKDGDKQQALVDKVRELSGSMPDMYGPSISVPLEWQQCKAASDCQVVYSECGTQYVGVNKASVETTEAEWKKACERVKRGAIAALVMKPEVKCESNRCVARASTAGLDEALENFGGGSGGLSGRIGKAGPGAVGRNRPSASIAVSKARVKGSLDAALVRRVVRARQRQWLYCYEREQMRSGKKPQSARVDISIEIDARGRTATASVSGDGGKELHDCITIRARRWRYPAPPKGDVNRVTLVAKFTPAPKPAKKDEGGIGVGDKGSR